jgi:hypothetical protein
MHVVEDKYSLTTRGVHLAVEACGKKRVDEEHGVCGSHWSMCCPIRGLSLFGWPRCDVLPSLILREKGDFNKKSKFLNVHQRKNLR